MALASLAAAPLALELGMRLTHPYLPRDFKIVWIRSQMMRDQRLHRFHPGLLWAPNPTLSLRYPDARFRWRIQHAAHPASPSFGYRADAPARRADLVVLGDSYTYGFEVDQDSDWVERLKRATGLSAVNLAVTSYGTSQEALLYELYGRAFKPRFVLQVIATNDPLDNVFFNEVNAAKDPAVLNLCWFLGVPQRSLACSAASWAMRRTVVGGIAVFELQALLKRRSAEDPEMRRGTEMICRDVARLRALTKAAGVKYAAALIGPWRQARLKPLKERLDACLAAEGVPALQLAENLEARRRGRPLVGRFDWHWNDEGHAYVAERLGDFAARLGWVKTH